MIRQLTEKDRNIVMPFLKKDSSMNLFIIGDIERFGFETDFQEVWGEFQGDALRSILLRYYNSFVFYAEGDYNVHGFAGIIKNYSRGTQISGKKDIIEQFETVLDFTKKESFYFAECKGDEQLGSTDLPVKKATIEDIDKVYALLKTIDEFNLTDDFRERMKNNLRTNLGRIYYLEVEGKVVATASTTAETPLSAMIVAVATDKSYRKRGYATAVMRKLVRDLLDEGKYSCLFYDNPAAGSIYKRLGFKDIGLWTIYHLST